MTDKPPPETATRCFACGPDNPIGLRIAFTVEDGVCTGTFTPGENHVGFDDTVHGGIIFSALDDVMANLLYLQGIRAYTARSQIRYRRALRVGESIALSSRVATDRGRLVTVRGEARLAADGALVADCSAQFMADPG